MKGKTITGVCVLLVLSATIVQAATFVVLQDEGVIGVESANVVKADNEVLIVVDISENEFARINETTGNRTWNYSSSGAAVAIADNTIFMSDTIRWFNGTLKDNTPVPADSGDAYYDSNDEIYYVAGSNALYAIYESNGTAKWTNTNNRHYSVEATENWVWTIRGSGATSSGADVRRYYKNNGTLAEIYDITPGSQATNNEMKHHDGYFYIKLDQGDGSAVVQQYELSTTDSTIISNETVQTTQEFSDKIAINDTYVFVQEFGGSNVSAYHHDTLDFEESFASNGWGIHYYQFGVETGPEIITNLEIKINNWQALDSTQPYEVILNQTDANGSVNLTDVTEHSNVTIYNISNTTGFTQPIATVNNTTDEIVSYNQTGVVSVNATYGGETANASNLTVANRNLSNIGILPPGQYISAFLGVDETTGGHNIGSETQWLIFIIIVAAGFGRAFDNDWIGLGLGTLTSILLWVVGFVGIGLMYTVVFFAIFVGILKVRVVNNTSQMSVDINDTRDFRR